MTFEQAELMRRHAREEPFVPAQPPRASNLPRPQDSAEYHAPKGLYTAITKDSIWEQGSQEWGDLDFTVPQCRHKRVGGLASLLEKQGPVEVVQAMHDGSIGFGMTVFISPILLLFLQTLIPSMTQSMGKLACNLYLETTRSLLYRCWYFVFSNTCGDM